MFRQDDKVAGRGRVIVVGAVERLGADTYVAAALWTFSDDRLHIHRPVGVKHKHGGESLPLLCGEAVEHNLMLLQESGDFFIGHLSVADDTVDEDPALGSLPGIVLAAIALAGLHHVAAAHWAATYYLLFVFHI